MICGVRVCRHTVSAVRRCGGQRSRLNVITQRALLHGTSRWRRSGLIPFTQWPLFMPRGKCWRVSCAVMTMDPESSLPPQLDTLSQWATLKTLLPSHHEALFLLKWNMVWWKNIINTCMNEIKSSSALHAFITETQHSHTFWGSVRPRPDWRLVRDGRRAAGGRSLDTHYFGSRIPGAVWTMASIITLVL